MPAIESGDRGPSEYSPQKMEQLRQFFRTRLEKSLRLTAYADKTDIPQWKKLARHATLSAYRDLSSLGLENEAKEILSRLQGSTNQ